MTKDIVQRLRETLTGEDTDEAMWKRIVSERQEAADTIHSLRVKLHRERSKRGHAIAQRQNERDPQHDRCPDPRCAAGGW